MKILSEQKELVDTETEFFIRDKDNIDDFLYEIESSYLKKEAANNFDQLDIIFVSGDMNVRPWSPSMKKVLTILRMCLRVNKYLYTSAWGFQALVFLCASNLEKNINIINGNGNGSKLSEINQMKKIINQVKQNDYFLDNTTGDLYGFNCETSEWIPKAQCGIHYRRAAEEFQSIGKFILKAPVYKANIQHKEKYSLFKSRRYEDLCTVKKVHLHHWAFENMDSEYIVPLKNAWDSHTFAFTNPKKKFTVLAESIRGPLVIEIPNILGTQFDNNAKYPQTLLPIKNFIHLALKFIKSSQSNTKSICSQNNQMKDNTINQILLKQKTQSKRKALLLLQERSEKMGFGQSLAQFKRTLGAQDEHDENENKDNDFKHVGFSAKKSHQPNVVKQNLVQSNKFKVSGKRVIENEIDPSPKNSAIKPKNVKIIDHNSPSYRNGEKRTTNVGFVDLKLDTENQSSQLDEVNENDFHGDDMDDDGQLQIKDLATSYNNNRFSIESNGQKQSQKNSKQTKLNNLTKSNVRRKLHPRISQDYLQPNERLWTPGNLSQVGNNFKRGISQKIMKTEISIPSHYASIYTNSKRIGTATTQNNSIQNFGETVSSQQQNQRLATKSEMVHPLTRTGRDFGNFESVFSGPWYSQEELQKMEQLKRDKQIMCGPFKSKVHIKDYFQEEKLNCEPANINNHQFRQTNSEKFVHGGWKITY